MKISYVMATEDQPERHEKLRELMEGLAQGLLDLVPDSPERALAFQKMEELFYWAGTGVARGSATEDAAN